MNKTISVVIPAYNIADYLSRCLDSILNQTYKNLEIIAVNDGSTDNTADILELYADRDKRIKVIDKENGGVTSARIAGINKATGEYIGFVDGDDYIEPDMYERLLNNMLKYNADISHCGYRTIVNKGERIHYFYNTGRVIRQDHTAGLKDLLSGSFIEPGLWNKLFHKTLFHSLLHDANIDISIRYNEDLLMNYVLFRAAEASVYEDFCPYNYMARSTSATRTRFNAHKVFDPLKVRKWILENAEPELEDIALGKYLLACMGAYAALYGMRNYREVRRSLKKELKDNRDKWVLLGKKEQIRLRLLLCFTGLYNGIYRFYERYFQRKVYE